MTEIRKPGENLTVSTPPVTPQQPFRSVPPEVRAGDAVSWEITLGDYPNPPYTLGYSFSAVINNAPVRFAIAAGDITGDANGNWSISVPSSESKNWQAGYYIWLCYVLDAQQNRTVIAQGRVKVLPDVIGSSSPIDPRTKNEKLLGAIDDLIHGRPTNAQDIQEYELQGRRVVRMKISELMYWRGIVAGWVRRERKARGEYVRPNEVGIAFGGQGGSF